MRHDKDEVENFVERCLRFISYREKKRMIVRKTS